MKFTCPIVFSGKLYIYIFIDEVKNKRIQISSVTYIYVCAWGCACTSLCVSRSEATIQGLLYHIPSYSLRQALSWHAVPTAWPGSELKSSLHLLCLVYVFTPSYFFFCGYFHSGLSSQAGLTGTLQTELSLSSVFIIPIYIPQVSRDEIFIRSKQ